jgi:hypothetical protein
MGLPSQKLQKFQLSYAQTQDNPGFLIYFRMVTRRTTITKQALTQIFAHENPICMITIEQIQTEKLYVPKRKLVNKNRGNQLMHHPYQMDRNQ